MPKRCVARRARLAPAAQRAARRGAEPLGNTPFHELSSCAADRILEPGLLPGARSAGRACAAGHQRHLPNLVVLDDDRPTAVSDERAARTGADMLSRWATMRMPPDADRQ